MIVIGKNPAFQFYVKDWLSDPELRPCSSSTRGIWIDMLCYMKWDTKQNGTLRAQYDDFIRMLSTTKQDFDKFIEEAKKYRFCDISVTVTGGNKYVTVINRRILREANERENTRLRVQKHRRNKDMKRYRNESVQNTPSPSPVTTPLSSKEDTLKSTDDEILTEGSKTKILEELEKLADKFYLDKTFNDVHVFKNKMLKKKTNPRAILHAMIRWDLKQDKDSNEAWGYCTNILKVENGNYNEKDFGKAEERSL